MREFATYNPHSCGQITRSPIHRPDHFATVQSYLNSYMTNPTEQSEYATRFNFYLIAVCCKKMYRRISAWTALGFIYKLAYAQQIQHWIDLYDWEAAPWQSKRGPGDTSLARYITSTHHLLDVLNKAPNFKPENVDTFMEAVLSNEPIYTKNTARAFHSFVVAALVNLGYFLKELKQLYGNKVKHAGLREALVMTEVFTRLFFYISSSSAFETHINVCTNNGSSISNLAPVYNQRKFYRDFGQMYGILPGQSRAPSSIKQGFLSLVSSGARKQSDSDPADEWLTETVVEAVEEGAQPIFHSVSKGFPFCKPHVMN